MSLLFLFSGAAVPPDQSFTIAADFGGLTADAGVTQRADTVIALDFSGLAADAAASQRNSGDVGMDFAGLAVDVIAEPRQLANVSEGIAALPGFVSPLHSAAQPVHLAVSALDFAPLDVDARGEMENARAPDRDFAGLALAAEVEAEDLDDALVSLATAESDDEILLALSGVWT